jgi:hypothetical protein
MAGDQLRLAQFGPAFAWLLDHGVASSRLASVFATSSQNVRVIASRSRRPSADVALEYADEAARRLVRSGPDFVVRTPARCRKLDALRHKIDDTVRLFATAYRFSEGIQALKQILPRIGYPQDSRRIALLANLHQQMAWFHVHLGRSESAAREAQQARGLWQAAHVESGSQEHVAEYVKAALIESQAWLLARRPENASRTLDIAQHAAESIGSGLGSDHYRQRGVALFQLRENEPAAEQFRRAAVAMDRMNEAEFPEQVSMTGARHIHLLGSPDVDGSEELSAVVLRRFGERSLEASMALHWAAACGLSTGSRAAERRTLDLLASRPVLSVQFGHQSTISSLLAVTPELGLDEKLRRMWIRRALYENAFRDR